jgi:hypothetical protein
MADDRLRQEFFYMVRLTSKYDFSKMEVVENILRMENQRQILVSPFGKRFKERIFDIAAGQETDSKCVLCGQHADNQVICNHCMETIGGSEYAKSQLKEEKKPFNIKKILQFILIGCLILILLFQIWIASLWVSIPDYNPREEARNSAFEKVPVSNKEEALAQILLDFPEEEGYTVTFAREDKEFTGRFLLNLGDCCLEVEDGLTSEEKYDYFFTDDVYAFYISYLEGNTGKVGMAEINHDGAIIIEGSFNDGRRTDSFYKFR